MCVLQLHAYVGYVYTNYWAITQKVIAHDRILFLL